MRGNCDGHSCATGRWRHPPSQERNIEDARQLRDSLVAKGWKLDADLKYTEVEGAEHNEEAWAARVEPMLKFLFGTK